MLRIKNLAFALVLANFLVGLNPFLAWGSQADLDKARSLSDQVDHLFQAGRYQEALPLAQQALEIRENALGPEHQDTVTSLNNLARIYTATGAYERALSLYQREIFTKDPGPEHPNIAISLNNQGELYSAMGDFEKALPLYQRSLEIKKKALGPEHLSTAIRLHNLAIIYSGRGDYDQALPLYKQSLKITEKTLGTEHLNTAKSLNGLAHVYRVLGDYDEALLLYQRALKIGEKILDTTHPTYTSSLRGLGIIYLDRKDWAQAENFFKLAESKTGLVEVALARNRPDEALQLLRSMHLVGFEYPETQVRFYTQEGLALAGLGRLPEATFSLWQAIQCSEAFRQRVTGARTGFLQAGGYGGYIRPYKGLLSVLARMALESLELPQYLRPYGPETQAAAFYFAEMTKARVLLESMAQAARKVSGAEIPPDLRQREQTLLDQIAAAEMQRDQAIRSGAWTVQEAKDKRDELNIELQLLIGELRQSQPVYAALHYPQPLPARDLPLRENEVLLEYALGEEACYVFVVRKGGVQKLYPVNLGRGALEAKVQEFMKPLLAGDEQLCHEPGERAL